MSVKAVCFVQSQLTNTIDQQLLYGYFSPIKAKGLGPQSASRNRVLSSSKMEPELVLWVSFMEDSKQF